ncbi:hypothetical protein EB077_03410, partial [bacterium]|nr:hypothetical protein [bacterium]
RLSQFPVGQGLFFAGQNHVHIQILASPTEQSLITTDPEQVKQIEQNAPQSTANSVDLQTNGGFNGAVQIQ